MLYAIQLMQQSKDQQPVSLPPDRHSSSGELTEERFFEELAEPPTQLPKKRRWLRCSQRPVFKRRRRIACLILMLLLLVAVGVPVFLSNPDWMDGDSLERFVSPIIGQVPQPILEEPVAEEEAAEGKDPGGETSSEEATEEEEEATAVPDDDTLYLTVPRLGLYNHTVQNDDSEEALDLGAIKLPYTGFPWQEEETNTYIACHRLGWPGTESYNQCLNLPSMQEGDKIVLEDANGTIYEYRVVETLIVGPDDNWVTRPVAGKDMVSLQTCVETPDDLHTLGPNWTARLVVRAERAKEGQGGGFRRIADDSLAAYTGLLLHAPSRSSYYGRALATARRTAIVLGNVATVATTEALLKLESLTLASNLPYPAV